MWRKYKAYHGVGKRSALFNLWAPLMLCGVFTQPSLLLCLFFQVAVSGLFCSPGSGSSLFLLLGAEDQPSVSLKKKKSEAWGYEICHFLSPLLLNLPNFSFNISSCLRGMYSCPPLQGQTCQLIGVIRLLICLKPHCVLTSPASGLLGSYRIYGGEWQKHLRQQGVWLLYSWLRTTIGALTCTCLQ